MAQKHIFQWQPLEFVRNAFCSDDLEQNIQIVATNCMNWLKFICLGPNQNYCYQHWFYMDDFSQTNQNDRAFSENRFGNSGVNWKENGYFWWLMYDNIFLLKSQTSGSSAGWTVLESKKLWKLEVNKSYLRATRHLTTYKEEVIHTSKSEKAIFSLIYPQNCHFNF